MTDLETAAYDRRIYVRRRFTEALNHCRVPRDLVLGHTDWGRSARMRVFLRMREHVTGTPCTEREIAAVIGYDVDTVRLLLRPRHATNIALQLKEQAMCELNAPNDVFFSTHRGRISLEDPRTYIEVRNAVWWHMRQQRIGLQLSYPEIAAATTGRSHSPVVKGVAAHQAKLDAMKRLQEAA